MAEEHTTPVTLIFFRMRPRALVSLIVAAAFVVGVARGRALAAPVVEPDAKLAPYRLDPKELDRAGRRALWKRNVGIGLAVPGVALVILGSVLVVNGSRSVNLFGGGVQLAAGSVTGGVGLALGIPGIVLWVTGQDDMDVVSWRRKQQQLPPITVGPVGLLLRF
jgi:hypothetical protein